MKTFLEASYKVDVAGLPPIFMDAKSPAEIRRKLRKQLKFPDDIENIKRITKGEKVLAFKDRLKTTLRGKGQDVEEAVQVDEVSQKTLTSYMKKASDQLEKGKVKDVNKIGNRAVGIDTAVHGIRKNAAKGKTIKGTIGAPKNVPEANNDSAAVEDILIDPKTIKKTQFLKPQNTTGLKTDLARLKKALGPNHPMNKNSKVSEQNVHEIAPILLAPAAMAVGTAAMRAAPFIARQADKVGAVLHSTQKLAKKAYKGFKSYMNKDKK
tara:strand:+ start:238 stop:1035 length:798 start_codon:yes stop_codon:yes gene_type:complete